MTGVQTCALPIYSKIHDWATSVLGSFEQLVQGIKNTRKFPGLAVGTNTTIGSYNYKYLLAVARLLVNWEIKRAEFIWVYPPPWQEYKQLVPMVSQASPFCVEAVKIGLAKKYYWRILNPPMGCYCESIFSHIGYAGHKEATLFVKTKASGAYALLEKEKIIEWKKEKACFSCKIKERCFGVQERYLDCFGNKELKAVPEAKGFGGYPA